MEYFPFTSNNTHTALPPKFINVENFNFKESLSSFLQVVAVKTMTSSLNDRLFALYFHKAILWQDFIVFCVPNLISISLIFQLFVFKIKTQCFTECEGRKDGTGWWWWGWAIMASTAPNILYVSSSPFIAQPPTLLFCKTQVGIRDLVNFSRITDWHKAPFSLRICNTDLPPAFTPSTDLQVAGTSVR